MSLKEAWYYTLKLVVNSWRAKVLLSSLMAFLSIIEPDDYIIFQILFRLRVLSMVFWTINWSIQNGFNMKKFLFGGVKIITYGVLLYFAQSVNLITHRDIWLEVFAGFMIFELLISVIKHCGELGIPMPSGIIKFILKQEKDFEDKYLGGNRKL